MIQQRAETHVDRAAHERALAVRLVARFKEVLHRLVRDHDSLAHASGEVGEGLAGETALQRLVAAHHPAGRAGAHGCLGAVGVGDDCQILWLKWL